MWITSSRRGIFVIVTVGAGSFGMIRNDDFGIMSVLGIMGIIFFIVMYMKITHKISKYLNEFKKIEEE